MTLPRLNFSSLSSEAVCGDIVRAFRLAAERLGYPTSYTPCNLDPGAINILFFFWDVPWETIAPFYPDCIVVNFEPMVEGTHAWNTNYLDVIKRCYLWEYSKSNFQRYRELGYKNADYVALGWEPEAAKIVPLTDILPDEQQDIDVVFFGSLTRRRIDILEALIGRGLRVETTNGRPWSLEERDDYMRRAKLVLNLHNWEDSRVVETPRLSILLRHRKAVVCELYPDSEIEPSIRDAVVGAPYDRLVDAVEELLADAPRRARLEREGLEKASLPLSPPDVGPALERFLAWRTHQPDRIAPPQMKPRVAVCMVLDGASNGWLQSLQSWSQQRDVELEVIVVASGNRDDIDEMATQASIPSLRLIRMPVACDRATARNIALAEAKSDYIVFSDPGDTASTERLQRQAALLESCADVDIVGCWCETQAAPLRFAERHHEILTEYLGPQPLVLSSCMIRRDFLKRSGLRHDPEFTVHDDLQMLCKCAVAGARFSVIPEPLHRPAEIALPADPVRAASLASRARALVLRHLLPQSSVEAIDRIAQLYAHWWPPELDFAEQLLKTLAHACATPAAPAQQRVEHEMLTRALRHETLRLLQVFFQAGLADKPWLEERFRDAEVAQFLAPAANQLPVRPFRA
jgi:hypothetical protein